MTTEQIKQLTTECEAISRKQRGATGDEYVRLDALWVEKAKELAAARLSDAIKKYSGRKDDER